MSCKLFCLKNTRFVTITFSRVYGLILQAYSIFYKLIQVAFNLYFLSQLLSLQGKVAFLFEFWFSRPPKKTEVTL